MGQLRTSTRDELQSFVAHPTTVVQHDTFHIGASPVSCLTTKSPEDGLQSLITDYMLTLESYVLYKKIIIWTE